MIAGPVLDNPEYTRLIEVARALVVCDRYLFWISSRAWNLLLRAVTRG